MRKLRISTLSCSSSASRQEDEEAELERDAIHYVNYSRRLDSYFQTIIDKSGTPQIASKLQRTNAGLYAYKRMYVCSIG